MGESRPQPLTGGTRRILRDDGSEILFVEGRGGVVTDSFGVSYVDFILGFGPVSIGHGNPEFNRRLQLALAGGLIFPGLSAAHERYCERLIAYYPGFRVVGFFKTGSEAVTAALRIADTVTGRRGVVRCGHTGWHDALIASTPHWHEPLESARRNQLRFTAAMRGVGPAEPATNWPSLKLCELRRILDHSPDWGSFLIDAYQLSMTTPATICEALRMCQSRGLLTVVDETKTAGRLSPVGALSEMVRFADLVVLGKAIGNGAPLSVLIARDGLAADCDCTSLGGTYSKELFGVQSALITMELMQARAGYKGLQVLGTRTVDTLNRAARSAGVSDRVNAVASFGGTIFELRYDSTIVNDHAIRQKLVTSFQRRGILLLDGHCCFVCADHDQLDWDKVSEQSSDAFAAWRDDCLNV